MAVRQVFTASQKPALTSGNVRLLQCPQQSIPRV